MVEAAGLRRSPRHNALTRARLQRQGQAHRRATAKTTARIGASRLRRHARLRLSQRLGRHGPRQLHAEFGQFAQHPDVIIGPVVGLKVFGFGVKEAVIMERTMNIYSAGSQGRPEIDRRKA